MDTSNICYNCFKNISTDIICPLCGYAKEKGQVSAHHLPPGTILQDKYLLGPVIGQGGFGITYLAKDIKLDQKLAIKEYFPYGLAARIPGSINIDSSSGEINEKISFGLHRFLEEAKMLARFFEHPNIITVRDYFEANGTAYMVMNYIDGLTLEQYLYLKGGKISFDQALGIMMPVLDTLAVIHEEGIMHRDISPDNLIIDCEGRIVLIDFGAARLAMGGKNKSISVMQKSGYSPEEQYRSRGEQGPWTDIYAVAATMYRAITGHIPPESLDRTADDNLILPSNLGVKIKPHQEKALLKALAVRGIGRHQSVKDFQKELFEIGQPTSICLIPQASPKLENNTGVEKNTPPMQDDELAKKPLKKYSILSYKNTALTVGLLTLVILFIYGIGGYRMEKQIPAGIRKSGADYYINYEKGTIPISELPIGARVVDPTWEWEFRTGDGYSDSGTVKPVTWIVVAKNHYRGMEAHVTLMAEEIIGFYAFDNSTDRGKTYGNSSWEDSGSTNATIALRPWLNSQGIHSNEGFYNVYSESFKGSLLLTQLPNREWDSGNQYITEDLVFIPSTTELGDTDHNNTFPVGNVFPYFSGAGNKDRAAQLGNENYWYWTRSPAKIYIQYLRVVYSDGGFYISTRASDNTTGIRPVINIAAKLLVSAIE